MRRLFNDSDVVKLADTIRERTPRRTGSLRGSIRYQTLPNGFSVTVGVNGWTSQSGKSPYKYVRIVNDGKGYNEKNKDFIQYAVLHWAKTFIREVECRKIGVFYDEEEKFL